MHLKGVLFSEDSRYFLSSLKSLGFSVEIREEEKEVTVGGCGGMIPKKEAEIYVGSAGTAARFLTAMLALSEGVYTIQASEQMKRRPMRPLFEALEQLGAEFTYLEKEGFLPVLSSLTFAKSELPLAKSSHDKRYIKLLDHIPCFHNSLYSQSQ